MQNVNIKIMYSFPIHKCLLVRVYWRLLICRFEYIVKSQFFFLFLFYLKAKTQIFSGCANNKTEYKMRALLFILKFGLKTNTTHFTEPDYKKKKQFYRVWSGKNIRKKKKLKSIYYMKRAHNISDLLFGF